MPETMALVVATPSGYGAMRTRQRPVVTRSATAEAMTVQVSNVPLAEQRATRPTARQVARAVARYAPIARRTQGEMSGDVSAGLRDELAALREARKSAMSRLFPDE